MPKKKSRKKIMSVGWLPAKRKRIVILGLALSLVAVSVTLAYQRRREQGAQQKVETPALNKGRAQSAELETQSLSTNKPLKEYVYAGDKLVPQTNLPSSQTRQVFTFAR